jgi:hypothetical protein
MENENLLKEWKHEKKHFTVILNDVAKFIE